VGEGTFRGAAIPLSRAAVFLLLTESSF